MAISKVVVVDGNNLTVRIDRGVAGRGITDVQPVEIDNQLYLEFFFSDGTTETVGPVGTVQYFGEAPIVIDGPTISLSTVPVNFGGTGATTAAAARTNLNAADQATTISAGTGLSGGGSLAANRTISIANTAVTAGSYGSASSTLSATVNAQGQLTALADTPIAIANTQIIGLGTMSTQNANAVAITGGSITGITDLAVADGGTGASTAAGARTNLNAADQDVTISAGTGLSGGGSLAANRTLSIANTAVTAGSYGSASNTLSATVNAQGQLTALAATPIAIANTQVSGLGTASTLNAGVANGVATLDAGGTVPLSQIPASIQGGVSYQGSWNAATNTPTIVSSVGTKGYYYVVSVAGSTNINGITDWLPGDWIIFNGSVWEQIDNTDTVQSVNGYVGAVVLNAADVGAPPTTRTITAGTGLSGGGDLSSNRTISIDSTVVTLTGTQTLTNKTFGDNPTFSAGTANGVAYLNGSKVLTTGSALTFDGTTLGATNGVSVGSGISQTYIAGKVLQFYNTGSGGDGGIKAADDTSSVVAIGVNKTEVKFYSSGSEIGRFTSTGLGIGNSSPTAKLDVTGTAAISGAVTLSGGTANGVAYLNGSKVLTTGSALTFDGTNFAVGASATSSSALAYLNKASGSSDNGATGPTLFLNAGAETTTANLIRFNGAIAQGLFYGRAANADAHVWGGTSSGEFMRLTSTGLGIGTSSPAVPLEVSNASSGIMRITTVSGASQLQFKSSGTNLQYISYNIGGAGALSFYDSNSAAERMRLDSSGNLGLGVTPSAWDSANYKALQVSKAALVGIANVSILSGNWYADTGGDKYIATGTAARVDVNNSGQIQFKLAPSGTAGNAISFTQAMTLDASGNLLVGKTSIANNAAGLRLYNDATDGGQIRFSRQSGSATQYAAYFYESSGGLVGSISTTSSVTAYNTSSDYRLKDITGPITTSGAYIDSLNPVEGTWKADGSTFVGLIAHEVQEASRTQVATGTKDGEEMQAMDYSNAELIANLIAEVKSLRARVAALESI